MGTVAVNYLAILGAAVAAYLIGWAWHSPLLFMETWTRLSGQGSERLQAMSSRKMTQSMVIMFVAVLLTSYVLAQFVSLLQVRTVAGAIALGTWVWVGFYATIQLGGYLWEGRPFKLYILEAGQTLVTTVVMSVMLALWA